MSKFKCGDLDVYNELRNSIKEEELPVFDTIALGVFTNAYTVLRKELHEQSQNLSTLNLEEFAETATNINHTLQCYEDIVMNINASIQPSIARFMQLENADVLDNAFSNFLKQNATFTYKELMNYFNERYSEKKLVKYIGNIPIYKKTLIFDKTEIDMRLQDLINKGIVIFIEENTQSKTKGKRIGTAQRYDSDIFISMPVLYALFVGQWNPFIVYPEIEPIAKETERIFKEIMSVDGEEKEHAGKILKLIFKDSSMQKVIHNIAGVLEMYYEQMNEPKPDFLVDTPEGVTLLVKPLDGEIYESVSV